MSTAIQWTDETWNPTTGCTRVSEGCRHCYIERTPAFRMANPPRRFVNGTTGVLLHPDRLDQPLHWKKPRRVFVNSLSDLFHEDVPDEFIQHVFAIMALTPQHTYQILTKRPERMRRILLDEEDRFFWALVEGNAQRIYSEQHPDEDRDAIGMNLAVHGPLPNVWLGVSVEDQPTADERIPILRKTPAAVRFVSAEPLLGPLDLLNLKDGTFNALDGLDYELIDGGPQSPALNWVIVGGESGPRARPCDLAWIRSLRDQCQTATVPVFVKQLGKEPRFDRDESARFFKDKKGGDPAEWPADLMVREFPR